MKERPSFGSPQAETAGRRCLKLPFGEHRQRLVKVPSVLWTAALGYAGFPSALLRLLARPDELLIIANEGRMKRFGERPSWGSAQAETAGRRCLKLPFGEHRQRLVKVPSVLWTAALGYAGFPSALLRLLARPIDCRYFRMYAVI